MNLTSPNIVNTTDPKVVFQLEMIKIISITLCILGFLFQVFMCTVRIRLNSVKNECCCNCAHILAIIISMVCIIDFISFLEGTVLKELRNILIGNVNEYTFTAVYGIALPVTGFTILFLIQSIDFIVFLKRNDNGLKCRKIKNTDSKVFPKSIEDKQNVESSVESEDVSII